MKNLMTAVAVGLFAASAAVNATTITFNEFASYASSPETPLGLNPISTQGFTFTAIGASGPGALETWPQDSPYLADQVGHAAVFVGLGGVAVKMTSTTSALFNFDSIQLADLYNNQKAGYNEGPQTVRFTFDFFGGGTSTEDRVLDTQPGLQTFVFNKTGLQSASWVTTSIDATTGYKVLSAQFDNVNVTAVPEPAVYPMLVAGLVLLGGVTRRKKMPRKPRGT